MSYTIHSFSLTKNQKKKLARAFNNKKAVNIKFKSNRLTGDFPIMITKGNKIKLTRLLKKMLDLFLE